MDTAKTKGDERKNPPAPAVILRWWIASTWLERAEVATPDAAEKFSTRFTRVRDTTTPEGKLAWLIGGGLNMTA